MRDLKEIIADNNKRAKKAAPSLAPGSCPKHPKYDGTHFPAQPCATCFQIWRHK